MAAAMPCETDFVGYTICVVEDNFDGDHASHAPQGSPSDRLPEHCAFCASGACAFAHVPALGVMPDVAARVPLASIPPSEPRVRAFVSPQFAILRPPN